MKKCLYFLMILGAVVICNSTIIKSQTIVWAKKGISQGFEYGNAIATDDSGNVYVTGQIEYTSVFDGYSLSSAGIHDIFVAKYSPTGVIKWIRRAGGSEGDIGYGIGIDAQHNVYITGEIETTVSFGSGISLTSSGGNDVFTAKYDVNGNIKWAKKFGNSASSDKGRAIAVSPSGNCYITGNFSVSVTVGSTSLSASGGNDIFIVKYDTQGNVVWAKKAGGSKQDRGFGIALDASENVYVTGSFTSPATFKSTTITNSGKLSAFVAKYNSSGSFQWVKAGGNCCDTTQGNAITLDPSGNIFVAGQFAVKAKFGSTTLTSAGLADIFIVKYDPSGSVLWAKRMGGSREDIAYGIAIKNDIGRAYVTGSVSTSGTLGSISYPFAGYKDIFLGSFSTSSGSEKWIKTYGSNNRDVGFGVSVNSQGNVYATGIFNGTVAFGSNTLTGYAGVPWADFFVMKILPPAVPMRNADEEEPSISDNFKTANPFEDVKIYPNPFHETFIVSTESPLSLGIYDLIGNLIERRESVMGETVLGEGLSRGMYYVVISDAGSKKTIPIIKTE